MTEEDSSINVRKRRKTCACDSCRRKRTKCQGGQPCRMCLNSGTECTYLTPRKRRGPQPKSSQEVKTSSIPENTNNKCKQKNKSNFKKYQHNVYDTLNCGNFKGLILSVQRVINEVNQPGTDLLCPQRDSPLFHVAGESTILTIDANGRLRNSARNSDNKYSCTPNANDQEGTSLFFGSTSTSCAEAIMRSNQFSCDGYMVISLRSSFAFPEPDPLMSTLPCSIGLVQLFVHLYFTHIHPQIPMIDKKSFIEMQESRYKDNLFLLNSMCAIVTQKTNILSTYGIKNASELHKTFFERARSLLEKRFDWPQVNTIQALILLSYLGSGMNNAASSYQYIGIACRQAIELGMHMNIYRDKRLLNHSPRSVKTAQLTWLCLYIADRYVGTYLGRPSAISDYDVVLMPHANDDNTSNYADNLALHVKLCTLLGKISDAINRSSMFGTTKTEDLLKTYYSLKPRLLSLQSCVQVPKESESWNTRHHLYLLYRASYILLHRLTPGLIDYSCVNRAIEISRILSSVLLSHNSEGDDRFTYKEYVFTMPVVVYFALTGAVLLLDVYIKQLSKKSQPPDERRVNNVDSSNGNEFSADDDSLSPMLGDINLREEIIKYTTIFDKLKGVSLYSVYYKKIIMEGLESCIAQSSDDDAVYSSQKHGENSSLKINKMQTHASGDALTQKNNPNSVFVDPGPYSDPINPFSFKPPNTNSKSHNEHILDYTDLPVLGQRSILPSHALKHSHIKPDSAHVILQNTVHQDPASAVVGPVETPLVTTFMPTKYWNNWGNSTDTHPNIDQVYANNTQSTSNDLRFKHQHEDNDLQLLEFNECWKSFNTHGGYELLTDEEYNE